MALWVASSYEQAHFTVPFWQEFSIQLHGFSDASERAYAAVIYLRMIDSSSNVQTSLVISKTKVTPIKRLTIPRLELCGAYLLTQLLHHVRQLFKLPLSSVFTWTDSTIVLNWLVGSPRRFKTYVGNRISYTLLTSSVQNDGVMLVVLKTQPTLYPEVSSHRSSWNIRCGGMVPRGSNCHLMTPY